MRYVYPRSGRGGLGSWLFRLFWRVAKAWWKAHQKEQAKQLKDQIKAVQLAERAKERAEKKTQPKKQPQKDRLALGPRPVLVPPPAIDTSVSLKTSPPPEEPDARLEELTSALKNLGWQKSLASQIAKKTLAQAPDAPIERLVVEALRKSRS